MKGIFRRMSISNSFAVSIVGFLIATNEEGLGEEAVFVVQSLHACTCVE